MSFITRIRLYPADMAEAKRRKSAFREVAKEYNKYPFITDRPGTIAKMMEMAFQAGVESTQTSVSQAMAKVPTLNDLDVPSLSRDLIDHWRRFQVGMRGKTPPTINRYAFILQPKTPGLPASMSRDNWYPNDDDLRGDPRSNKVINPLIKLGLLEQRTLGNGATAAILTEWGYELLLTGKTSHPKDRSPEGSSTYGRYALLYQSHDSERPSDGLLHVDELENSLAEFVIFNRAHGIGNSDRYPDGVVIEDIVFYPEDIMTSRFWYPYRRGEARVSVRDSDLRKLLKSGLLEMDGETPIISEWGYEMIVTGSTSHVEDRSPGRSSTYRAYYKVLQARL